MFFGVIYDRTVGSFWASVRSLGRARVDKIRHDAVNNSLSAFFADTDGWQMALASENLSDLVRPGLEEEFEAVRKRIFVPDSGPDKTYCTLEKQQHSANTNSCVCFSDSREPGMLKEEVSADVASVHLSPKVCLF